MAVVLWLDYYLHALLISGLIELAYDWCSSALTVSIEKLTTTPPVAGSVNLSHMHLILKGFESAV